MFTLWLVSLYSHCWPFNASQVFCNNVFLVETLTLTSCCIPVVAVNNFTNFWIPPTLSFELNTKSWIFPSPGTKNPWYIPLGPVVRRTISNNTGLNFNLGFSFFSSKALSQIVFSILFRASNHQIVVKKNKTEFVNFNLSYLYSNLALTPSYLNPALKNPALAARVPIYGKPRMCALCGRAKSLVREWEPVE